MTEILFFNKGGRKTESVYKNVDIVPRDFFYGSEILQDRGYEIEQISTAEPYSGALSFIWRAIELLQSHITKVGMRLHLVKELQARMRKAKIAISFTDGFSITLGYYYRKKLYDAPFLVGCFHGLSDFESKVPKVIRPILTWKIKQALNRLDHIAFFGPADRQYSINRFHIAPDKTSIILFGVDTEYWVPGIEKPENYIFSMGQDPNRDFETLINAEVNLPIRIHTALSLRIPATKTNIEKTTGSYQKATLSNNELRKLYQKSLAVALPLKDVYQPTGYSVALQAMSCGKPLVLSNIRGLWAPELFKDGENCLLVKPGDSMELSIAIERLKNDHELREKISKNARATIEKYFNLECAANSVQTLIQQSPAFK